MRARNRELIALIPASLLLTAGFAGVFIQRSSKIPNLTLTYGAIFLALCVAGHILVRITLPHADPYLFPLVVCLVAEIENVVPILIAHPLFETCLDDGRFRSLCAENDDTGSEEQTAHELKISISDYPYSALPKGGKYGVSPLQLAQRNVSGRGWLRSAAG